MIRLHLDATLDEGRTLPLDARAVHHLGTVMRRAAGDRIALFNRADGEWEGVLGALRHGRGSVVVGARLRPPAPEPGPWLVLALLKRDAVDIVVEKATELGAERLLPVRTDRTVVPHLNLERLHRIAVEAAEQCGRLTIPSIDEPVALTDLLGRWDPARPLVLAEPGATRPLGRAGLDPATAALLVGPEGGWASGELDALHRLSFVVPVSLGPRILRAETAAIAGLALLQGGNPSWRQVPGDPGNGTRTGAATPARDGPSEADGRTMDGAR